MKIILPEIERVKKDIPAGNLNVRFRQMRCMYQVFAGSKYLSGACGETAEMAILELKKIYNVPNDTKIKIN